MLNAFYVVSIYSEMIFRNFIFKGFKQQKNGCMTVRNFQN